MKLQKAKVAPQRWKNGAAARKRRMDFGLTMPAAGAATTGAVTAAGAAGTATTGAVTAAGAAGAAAGAAN